MPQTTPNRAYEYPCYSDLNNFPAQLQAFAEDVDLDIEDLVDDVAAARLRPTMRARVTPPAPQSIPNNVATPINWTAQTIDTSGMITPPSTNITFPVTGMYLASYHGIWAVSDTGFRRVVFRNTTAAADMAIVQQEAGNVNPSAPNIVAILSASAGNVMQVQVTQTSGGALNIDDLALNITQVA